MIAASGTLSASAGSATPYSVTVTASDGTLHASQTFNWTVTANPVTLTNPGDQTNTEGDSVSLQLSATGDSGLTYGASGLPSGLSINSSTGLISGTVASGDSVNGPYTVTITATDTQGHSAAQQFTWNVNAPASVLTLTNPGNQSNAEGDNVSLQVQASDPDGDMLEYTASGLPVGLLIDPFTGLIQGTVDYSAAEIAGGQYHVTVTVNDGNGQTASQSFLWTIADTPQAPWLEYPEFQDSQDGMAASLQLVGGSPDGKTLTYSATGLPAGLSVNPNTGLISGTITAAMGSYTVTATVSDGTQIASQTFTWQVTCEAAPKVILAINGTVDHSDDVGIVNPSLPIPLTITIQDAGPGLHLIQISIPSGRSEVSQSQVELANGGSATIQLIPLQESQAPDDVNIQASVDGLLAADQVMTNTTVDEGTSGGSETPSGMAAALAPNADVAKFANDGHIKNKDTPKGMADRIPPSKDAAVKTPFEWTLGQKLGPGEKLYIVIKGDAHKDDNNPNPDPKAGEVFFAVGTGTNFRALAIGSSYNADTTYTDYLWADQQTDPGDDGKIKLDFEYSPQKVIKTSEGFSVAAIPIAVKMSNPVKLQGKNYSDEREKYDIRWGAGYKVVPVSDSGYQTDLHEVKYIEKILPTEPTGAMAHFVAKGVEVQKKLGRADQFAIDYNSIGDDRLGFPLTERIARMRILDSIIKVINEKGKGAAVMVQYFVFTDARTGLTKETVIDKSGFSIEYGLAAVEKEYGILVRRVAKEVEDHGAAPGIIAKDDTESIVDRLE